MSVWISSPQIRSLLHYPIQKPKPKCLQQNSNDGIPIEDVKMLSKFKSRHNYIRVLQVSRAADHPFAGSRLLLLDTPGNIHSISFPFNPLSETYFDVFATIAPILPPSGPIAILGFGAGSAARSILELYPDVAVYGWEIDSSVVDVGRKYFGLDKLEKVYRDRLRIHIGDALKASFDGGFSGILVDLFRKGSLLPALQERETWERLRKLLRQGGRIMVNVGGSCVEAEDKRIDGRVVMEATLKAMWEVFGDDVLVLSLGDGKNDSSLALTGVLPDVHEWKKRLPKSLRHYVDMWRPYKEWCGSGF